MSGLNNMEHIIREMKKSDCKDVTHVITIAWNETYRGIVPDDILDNMYSNEEERTIQKVKHCYCITDESQPVFFLELGEKMSMDEE